MMMNVMTVDTMKMVFDDADGGGGCCCVALCFVC